MGAANFVNTATGKSAKEAFNSLVEDARHEYGHGGYTGTIAEKDSFKIATSTVFETYEDASKFVDDFFDDPSDMEIDDKWGPAGCVKYKDKNANVCFMFFGWASS